MGKKFIPPSLGIFASMIGVGIISPILPLYSKMLGAEELELGLIFSAYFGTKTISMPIIGKISDKYGRKRLIIIGLILYIITSFLYILTTSVNELILVRILQGIASGMIIPIAVAYIGERIPRGEEGKYIGMFNTFFFLGLGVGPLIGGALTERVGMEFAFYGMGGVNFIALIIILKFMKDKIEKKKKVNKVTVKNITPLFKGTLLLRLVIALARGVFICFLPIIGGINLGFSSEQIGMLLSLNILLTGSLQMVGGKIGDKVSRKLVIIVGSIIDIICFLLIPWASNFFHFLLICITSSVGLTLILPSTTAIITKEGKKYGMGEVMGFYNMIKNVGIGLGPIIGGWVAHHFSVEGSFKVAAGVEVVGVIIFLILQRKSKKCFVE